MTTKTTVPLPGPAAPASLPAEVVATGQPIPPIDRLKIFSDKQWEEFVLEWADSLREEYSNVERCGGAGDMGRDIVAVCKDGGGAWDNYQCKHYKNALTPGDVWLEFGKLIYYTRRGDYTYPRRYFFVAPHGAGTTLSNLLRKPDQLRAGLKASWNSRCREKITSTDVVELDSALEAYIDSLDFSIFAAVPPLRIIDAHAKTRWYVARFGGGLPPRPLMVQPPASPAHIEARYVRQLLDAYADHLKCPIISPTDLSRNADLSEHFSDARLEFYSAESLRVFSRDTLPPGEFEKLQDEIHSGIRDEIRGEHADGYRRVLAVVRMAKLLPMAGHALHSRLSVRDHGGVCHQLANDDKLRWVR